jgi:hypothetical protein
MFIANTATLSFVLFLFLHIAFLFLFFYDFLNGKLKFEIFKINGLPDNWMGNLFQYFIYGGVPIGWILLLVSISLFVSVFNKLDYYSNQYGKPIDLGTKQLYEITSFKTISVISTVILAIFYILARTQFKFDGKIGVFETDTLGVQLVALFLVIISFLLYFSLIDVKNYTFFWITIVSIVGYFLFSHFNTFVGGRYFLKYIVSSVAIIAFLSLLIDGIVNDNKNSLYALIPVSVFFVQLFLLFVAKKNIGGGNISAFVLPIVVLSVVALYTLTSVSTFLGVSINKELNLLPQT